MKRASLIPNKLREIRRQKKMKQSEVGEIVGIPAQYVGSIELGKVDPSISLIEAIAAALDCEVRLLIKE